MRARLVDEALHLLPAQVLAEAQVRGEGQRLPHRRLRRVDVVLLHVAAHPRKRRLLLGMALQQARHSTSCQRGPCLLKQRYAQCNSYQPMKWRYTVLELNLHFGVAFNEVAIEVI